MTDAADTPLDRKALEAADLPPYPGIGLAAVTLVTSAALANEAGTHLLAADAVGFDTESKPTFMKGEVSTGPHLVQLATDERAWLFPSRCAEGLPVVKAVLEAAAIRKIGFGLGNDRSALQARFGIALDNVRRQARTASRKFSTVDTTYFCSCSRWARTSWRTDR